MKIRMLLLSLLGLVVMTAFMLGWRMTKSPTALANSSITRTAITMAVAMIGRLCTMPTAVITESSENTMSMIMICPISTGSALPTERRARG